MRVTLVTSRAIYRKYNHTASKLYVWQRHCVSETHRVLTGLKNARGLIPSDRAFSLALYEIMAHYTGYWKLESVLTGEQENNVASCCPSDRYVRCATKEIASIRTESSITLVWVESIKTSNGLLADSNLAGNLQRRRCERVVKEVLFGGFSEVVLLVDMLRSRPIRFILIMI